MKDQILFGGGDTNVYGYVAGDPIRFFDASGLAKGGKQNLSTEGYTRLSDAKMVEAAMKAVKAAGQMKRYKALRALLKVIKRGGSMCFVGVALSVMEELDLLARAIENDRTADEEFRQEIGPQEPYLMTPYGLVPNPYYDPRSGT